MENKNLYTMKQPDLGKKISELRKQKGLTQEELVAQCNINVRTIQRIEAGEVTPRSYTIKVILDVLGVQYDNVISTTYTQSKFDNILGISFKKHTQLLNTAWILGVIYFAVSTLEIITEYFRFDKEEMLFDDLWYSVIKTISIVCFALFMRGYVIAGNIHNNTLLQTVAFLFIVFHTLYGIYDIVSLHIFKETFEYVFFAKLLTFGITGILLGIAILQLKNKIGQLATVTGVIEIIVGISFTTVLLAFFGLFLLLPLEILEIILLYKIADKQRIENT